MPRVIAVIWPQFGPYHMDRCDALATRLGDEADVVGIEIASRSEVYAWSETGKSGLFWKHTIYPGRKFEDVYALARFFKTTALCFRLSAKDVFVTNYCYLDTSLLAFLLRLCGRRIYLMSDSKFDDKPRRIWKEFGKSLILLPYHGALVAGMRQESYLRFLGFRRRPVVQGYDTVSLERVLRLGDGAPALGGDRFPDRPFVLIGRFVLKKDIRTAIAAYASYRELAGADAREFHICGSGSLDRDIRRQITDLRLSGVVLHGFLQQDGIARVLSRGLALIVPSVEEQWGLVVNEALAFSLPILATDQVGARDRLIRTGVNGYIFEPGNVAGLAHLMYRVGHDEAEWRRLVEGSAEFRCLADTARFAEGVVQLLKMTSSGDRQAPGSPDERKHDPASASRKSL